MKRPTLLAIVSKFAISITGVILISLACGSSLFLSEAAWWLTGTQKGVATIIAIGLLIAAIASATRLALRLWEVGQAQAPLSSPPGWKLLRFAETFFSKKTFSVVLEPALSDMQKEHIEALGTGHPWQARLVLLRGYFSFWSAVFAQLPISLIRRVYEVWVATKAGG